MQGGPFHALLKTLGVVRDGTSGAVRPAALFIALLWAPVIILGVASWMLRANPPPILFDPALHARLAALSPLQYVPDIQAPLLVVLHDRDDLVIPVGESRRLRAALAGRTGVSYTEFTLFQHMDPTKGRLSPLGLMRQLGRFFHAVYPVFRLAAAP